MTEPISQSGLSVKVRQRLLLGAIVLVVAAAAVTGVLLSDRGTAEPRTKSAKTTTLVAPGSQVDPRDAWRGQADAQMKSLEQRSRETDQKNIELEQQNKAMLDRLKKLEATGLTDLPPPPVAVPPLRPDLGPTKLPPPLPVAPGAQNTFPAVPPGRPPMGTPETAAAPNTTRSIISVAVGTAISKPASNQTTGGQKAQTKTADNYLPSGSFTRAVLLGGLDAPTGGQSQRNPQPVLLRLSDNAVLPNHYRSAIKECFVVGAGYGDLSAERAYIRTETLSCITRSGRAIELPIKGYVAGEDGKAGMRGRLVSKQGQLLANALTAGIASGIGHAFQQGATSYSVSPLGSTATVNQGEQLTAGLGTGIGRALDRLAQYYITLAEKVFPVIEVDAGRSVDVVITQGTVLEGFEAAADERTSGPSQNPSITRKTHDPDY